MSVRRNRYLFAALLALAACSGQADTATRQQDGSPQASFSDEDRRAARALSVGGPEARATGSPGFYATLCSLALKSIDERLQDSGLLSAEQNRAFARAREIYAGRAAAGSASERDDWRREVEATYPNPNERTRFTIGCLKDLTGT